LVLLLHLCSIAAYAEEVFDASLTGTAPLFAASASAKDFPSLESQLSELYLSSQSDPLWAAVARERQQDLQLADDGSVLVWLLQEPGTLTNTIDIPALVRLGGRVAGVSDHFLEAWIPVAILPRVTHEVPGVTFVRVPVRWEPAYVSQGVQLSGATAFHSAGVRGAGVKVAVVDTGFSGLSSAIANGELPSTLVTADFSGAGIETGGIHGTACAEIVYDMAPEAQLYVVKIDGILLSSTENAANYCIAQGVHVVSSSLGLTYANFFDGQGDVCGIVNNLYTHNILPVIAAGNFAGNAGDAHHEGITVDSNSNGWHEFAPSKETMGFTAAAGVPVLLVLNWNGWPVTAQDYDLYVFNNTLTYAWYWATPQTGSQPPVEGGFFTPPYTGTYYLAIWRYNAAPGIRYEVYARSVGSFELPVAQSSLTCPADAAGALAVGAINYANWTSGPQEPYSSQGPTNDGRLKPEICGPDAVTTLSYYPTAFTGTSAAAPHVAGAAALLKSAHPTWTASQLRGELTSSAIDMGTGGADYVYGYGRLRLLSPFETISINSTPITGVTVDVTPADASGHADGVTNFTRLYPEDSQVSLVAPASFGGYQFSFWDIDGAAQAEGIQQVLVIANGPHTVIAHYVSQHFSDVPPSHWAYAQIEACFGAGIVQGYDDGKYHPEYPVTRDQMAVYIARALAGGDANVPDFTNTPTFPDVPTGNWALKYVEYAVDEGVVTGYDDGYYHPTEEVNRGQMAVYVARAMVAPGGDAAIPDPVPPATFPDVPATFWAYKQVEYCVGQGVVKGYDDGNYHPDYPVTRDQMAVYIARAFGLL
jgi:subtilisin family serine protease